MYVLYATPENMVYNAYAIRELINVFAKKNQIFIVLVEQQCWLDDIM